MSDKKNKKEWEEAFVSLNTLFLDDQNPRISDRFVNSSQEELIRELLKNEEVYALAEQLVKGGEQLLEPCIVIKSVKGFVVLEGNRRVAAYKILKNPDIANEENKKKLVRLAKSFQTPERIKVVIVSSRKIAAPYIEAKHTKYSVRRWLPYQQKLFIKRNADNKQIKARDIFQANLYELSRDLELPEEIMSIVSDPRTFKLSDLIRTAGSSLGRDFLGYDVDKNGEILIKNKEEFDSRLVKIVTDIATGDLSSRKGANNNDELKKYFRKISSEGFLADSNYKNTKKKNQALDNQSINPPFHVPSSIPSHTWSTTETIKLVNYLCSRFHLMAKQLTLRYSSRATLLINDEYDVQDLFESTLRLFFDDVRREETTGSMAGGSNRFDIYLKQDKVGIEIKKTRKGLDTSRKVGDAVLVDLPRYRTHKNCEIIICFIYDPDSKIQNPAGLVNDLQNESRDNFKIIVNINQKG